MIMGAVIGGVTAGVGVGALLLVYAIFVPRPKCPDCGEPFPMFRKPASRKQALWGGGACARCGCEVDRRGRKITDEQSDA
jgi:hypothetical protein